MQGIFFRVHEEGHGVALGLAWTLLSLHRLRQSMKDSLPQRFETFVREELPELQGARILLAVSGGLDSMALAWLCVEAGWSVGVAHCNFGLRGAEADADEAFVAAFAQARQLPFHVRRFDARAEARMRGISIQMAARRLRYAWFEELADAHDYHYIATAHHLEDSFETLLLNLLRGTGLVGLQGIPLRRGRVVRPLLGFGKGELEAWMRARGRTWRIDSSNASTIYRRNFLNREILPLFDTLAPGWRHAYGRTSALVRDGLALWRQAVAELLDRLVIEKEGCQSLELDALRRQVGGRAVLWEWLRPRGFSSAQVAEIWRCRRSGARFVSGGWTVWYDRGTLWLVLRDEETGWEPLYWPGPEESLALPDGRWLQAEILDAPPEVFPDDPAHAWLDAEKVRWPLVVRPWRAGDRFCPLGMGGRSKKLQDLFSDMKLSAVEKRRVPILETDGTICWVAGLRLDERFKVGAQTRIVLHLWLE